MTRAGLFSNRVQQGFWPPCYSGVDDRDKYPAINPCGQCHVSVHCQVRQFGSFRSKLAAAIATIETGEDGCADLQGPQVVESCLTWQWKTYQCRLI